MGRGLRFALRFLALVPFRMRRRRRIATFFITLLRNRTGGPRGMSRSNGVEVSCHGPIPLPVVPPVRD